VFMKVAGDQKFNHWSECQAKKQAKPGVPLVSIISQAIETTGTELGAETSGTIGAEVL
jgi:hypothetical protein